MLHDGFDGFRLNEDGDRIQLGYLEPLDCIAAHI